MMMSAVSVVTVALNGLAAAWQRGPPTHHFPMVPHRSPIPVSV